MKTTIETIILLSAISFTAIYIVKYIKDSLDCEKSCKNCPHSKNCGKK